jgi:glycosyltransferase involved in cell wall biosynthesis
MDGALFANPLDIEEMAERINQLVHDEALRQKLIAQGKLNVQKHSWEETAKKLYENLRNK